MKDWCWKIASVTQPISTPSVVFLSAQNLRPVTCLTFHVWPIISSTGCTAKTILVLNKSSANQLPLILGQDSVNQALQYMDLPAEPLLEHASDSENDEGMPAAKKPKNASIVQDAFFNKPMRVVPSQKVPRLVLGDGLVNIDWFVFL